MEWKGGRHARRRYEEESEGLNGGDEKSHVREETA